jgi:ribosomal protein S18 acetylase RimI-like enzyme
MPTDSLQTYLAELREKIGFSVGILSPKHTEQVVELDAHIIKTLSHPDLYHPPYDQAILQVCLRNGLAIGVWKEQALIAYLLAYYPSEHLDNLGRDVDIPREQLDEVAQFWGIAVHTAYRHRSLAFELTKSAMHILTAFGYQSIMATCHPENYYSLRNLLQLGFRIRRLKEKYGGKLRYVLCYNSHQDTNSSWSKMVIDSTDFTTQERLLQEGSIGMELLKTEQGYQIVFAKEEKEF